MRRKLKSSTETGKIWKQVAIFFSIWVLFHENSRTTGLQGKGEGISLTPHWHFHPLQGHLGIGRAITAEGLPGLEPGTFGFPAKVANH